MKHFVDTCADYSVHISSIHSQCSVSAKHMKCLKCSVYSVFLHESIYQKIRM